MPFERTLTSDDLLSHLRDRLPTAGVPRVVALDNAGIHTRKAVKAARPELAKLGIYLYDLPPYSPELNRIGPVFKQVKYHDMPTRSFITRADLRKAVEDGFETYRRRLRTKGDSGLVQPQPTACLSGSVGTHPKWAHTSPRRSQLDSSFVERGVLQLKRLHRAAVISLFPWNGSSNPEPKAMPVPRERRDPLKLARHYQALIDSGKFENRAALARHLGVSRARVTQVLKRLNATSAAAGQSDG